MRKILTIVVPTYNAEKYLRDNLESFCIKEILDDIEVLIINDGSTDGSLEIAEDYVRRFPKTYSVITKENGGHGSGINCGIKNANGVYFKVVDADDWVAAKPFLKLVKFLKETESDIVYTGFFWVFDNGQNNKDSFKKKVEFVKPFNQVIYKKEYRFDDIAENLYIKMHNMTIKTNILKENHIKIDEHCYYVDAEYITYPIPYVESISFLEDFVYQYRIGSVGQSIGIDKMQRNEENYDKVIDSLLGFYKELNDIPLCSEVKRLYLANIIARIVAGKIKIMLSFTASIEKKKQLVIFDEMLKREFPQIYECNVNKAVKILRRTNYMTYLPASVLVRKKY